MSQNDPRLRIREIRPEEREELIERVSRRQREERRESARPMSPDRDFTWDNTNFEKNDYE